MRLSEKSIELNFCHQVSGSLSQPIWWFGATQRQERLAGWDVAQKVGGRWIKFQLKASAEVLSTGARRFRGHHHQLVELKNRARRPLSVFYVFPTLGTTRELVHVNFDLLPHLRLLDVYDVPTGIQPPTSRNGALRRSELHYFDLHANLNSVTIHSDPVEVATREVEQLGGQIRELMRAEAEEPPFEDPAEAAESTSEFLRTGRNRVAAFLPLG